ncbi:hypothetical protein ATS71_13745 [Pseudoalteromonas sp. H71]|nr:hypothetical protein ATS71_13745 [Pseudoalteromonas sp. H71]
MLILSLAVFAFSSYRMESCGYDCGLFVVGSGISTIVYYVLSFWISLIMAAIGIYCLLRLRRYKKLDLNE